MAPQRRVVINDKVIQDFIDTNRPHTAGSNVKPPASRRGRCQNEAPKTAPSRVTSSRAGGFPATAKRATQSARPAFGRHMTHGTASAMEDDEAVRTRRYWENFAAKKSQELKREIDEDHKVERSKREIVFSARVPMGPCCSRTNVGNMQTGLYDVSKMARTRSDSVESIATDISLLTCSSGDRNAYNVINLSRRKKKKSPKAKPEVTPVKPDWEALAREHHGALYKLMQRDAAMLSGVDPRGQRMGGNRVEAAEIMTSEENALLMGCGYYTRGPPRLKKSMSTENVITGGDISRRPGAASGHLRRMRTVSHGSSTENRCLEQPRGESGATPTPAAVKRAVGRQQRSDSLPAYNNTPINPPTVSHYPGHEGPRPHTGGPNIANNHGERPSRVANGDAAMTSLHNGIVSRKIRRRMDTTLAALERITGHGDDREGVFEVEGEKGKLTSADYARFPRYPQNVRVAPQLTKVIRTEVTSGLNRKRIRHLRNGDLHGDAASGQGRTERNLMIFNWLQALPEEEEFRVPAAPGLVERVHGGVPEARRTDGLYHSVTESSSRDTGNCHGSQSSTSDITE